MCMTQLFVRNFFDKSVDKFIAEATLNVSTSERISEFELVSAQNNEISPQQFDSKQ